MTLTDNHKTKKMGETEHDCGAKYKILTTESTENTEERGGGLIQISASLPLPSVFSVLSVVYSPPVKNLWVIERPRPVPTYIALGSNEGDSPHLIQEALSHLSCLPCHDFQASSLYETAPEHCSGGPFINAVCRFKTTLPLPELISAIEKIEQLLGKKPKAKNAPRPIDLDLLFYGSRKYSVLGYTIPHPRWQERSFVIRPLLDLTDKLTIEEETFDLRKLCSSLL